MFNGKLSGSFDYFDKNTTDLLFNFDAIQPAPATKYWINLPGNIINNGFEFLLSGTIIQNQKVTWRLSVNGAFLHNEVKNYNGPTVLTGGLNAQGSSGATVQRLATGHPLNAFYTREFLGFDANGFAKYTDNGNTFYFVGDPNPKFIGGLSTDVTVSKWNFGMNLSVSRGGQIYNETQHGVLNIGNLGKWNIAKRLQGTTENLSNPVTASSRYIEKADYVKFGNLTARYNLGNIGSVIKNFSITLVGQNLFYVTNYTGFSPEVNTDKQVNGNISYGLEYIPYPTARNIQLGINFSL
jgi:iron complex outermembrane receptor protein